ncbi:MAG: dihydroorotate dehydrogenase electron transfer subunit [Planctomycetes bacterium]|nr:dihydroorotate dehydrogenase electron transfer subunit [Planctomycetota bacterium]
MAPSTASAATHTAQVVASRRCGPDAFVMELEVDRDLPDCRPGVFAMLSPADGSGPVLPRPFSLYDLLTPTRLSFLIQELGTGTRALGKMSAGAEIEMTFPLGNGFTLPAAERPVVLLAGGVGSAPFLHYARQRVAAAAGDRTWYFMGGRTKDRLYDHQAFLECDITTQLSTDDGSYGFHGNVIASLDSQRLAGKIPADALYCACGPSGLLHGFADYARENKLDAQISLETYMGCGFGVCNACPVPTQPDGPLGAWPWARTCQDGPVFPLTSIVF